MVLAPELVFLALVIVTIALAWFAAKLIEALVRPLASAFNWVPFVGHSIASAITNAAQAVTSALGKVEDGCDRLVGGTWHATAKMLDKTWNVIHGNSAVVAHLAQLVANLVAPIHALRALAAHLSSVVSSLEHPLRALERKVHGIDRTVKSLERDLSHGIGSDVLPRIKSLERELHTAERTTSRDIAAAESQAEAATADLWTWITGVGRMPLTLTFAGAVAIALSTLGLGGLRCKSLLGSLKNRGCGLWSGLEDLLGLFVDALILTDLCAILPETVKFFGYVEGALTGLISQAANAVCSLPNQKWTTLNVAPGPQPTAQAFDAATLPPNV